MNADFIAIRSFDKLGILTCFAIFSKSGIIRLYGISAAHVLLGSDRMAGLKDAIDVFHSNEHLRWIEDAGLLEKAYFINGTGIAPELGLLDAGSFLIKPKVADLIKDRITKLKYSQKLKNTIVYGYSVQSNLTLKAVVSDVIHYSSKFDLNFDLEISFMNGGTHEGDSGMLSRTQNGSAVAMHVYGDARHTYTTFINRISQKIDMPLYRLKIDGRRN